jgi:hypothetical protein
VPAGERLSFEAVGNRLGNDVDPLITIRDARGKIVAERDNDAGLYFDFRFAHTFAEAGAYTVELRDARFHGSDHAFYVLRMGRFPATRVALPMAIQWSKRSVRFPGLEPSFRAFSHGAEAICLTARGDGPVLRRREAKGDDGSAWLPMEAATPGSGHQRRAIRLQRDFARVPGMLWRLKSRATGTSFVSAGKRTEDRCGPSAGVQLAGGPETLSRRQGKEFRASGKTSRRKRSSSTSPPRSRRLRPDGATPIAMVDRRSAIGC